MQKRHTHFNYFLWVVFIFQYQEFHQFPRYLFLQTPQPVPKLRKKLIRLKLRFFNYTPTCKTSTCFHDISFQNTKLKTLSENIYIPNITAKAKYVENIERATDRKNFLSPRLKALRLTFHKHYCWMTNAIYPMMTFIWKQMWIWIVLH